MVDSQRKGFFLFDVLFRSISFSQSLCCQRDSGRDEERDMDMDRHRPRQIPLEPSLYFTSKGLALAALSLRCRPVWRIFHLLYGIGETCVSGVKQKLATYCTAGVRNSDGPPGNLWGRRLRRITKIIPIFPPSKLVTHCTVLLRTHLRNSLPTTGLSQPAQTRGAENSVISVTS
jgi:hypothetical protein